MLLFTLTRFNGDTPLTQQSECSGDKDTKNKLHNLVASFIFIDSTALVK